jgi:hypothetical protein
VPTENHHECDGKQSLCVPSIKDWKDLKKREEWLHDQNGGAKKSKVATKIRSRLKVLKRGEVKIILVVK